MKLSDGLEAPGRPADPEAQRAADAVPGEMVR
jgi:hypothetical protein